jgi:hypothetical protein
MILPGPALPSALWHCAGEDWLSFNPETGETCLLSDLARFVVEQVQAAAAPLSHAALTDLVHADEPEFTRADCDKGISQAIQALQRARLLAVPSDTIALV